MTTKTILKARRATMFGDTIEIHIGAITQGESQSFAVAEPIMLKVRDSHLTTDHLPPAMVLQPEEAQQFMDELWNVGIRPTEGQGSAGQMAATTKHLEDMRKLVFLNVEGKA